MLPKTVVEKLAKLAGDPRVTEDLRAEYNETLVAASRMLQLNQRQETVLGMHVSDDLLLAILKDAKSTGASRNVQVALDLAVERIKQAKAEREASKT